MNAYAKNENLYKYEHFNNMYINFVLHRSSSFHEIHILSKFY